MTDTDANAGEAVGASALLVDPAALTPEIAATRLVELKTDPKFVSRYLSGDPYAAKDMKAVIAALNPNATTPEDKALAERHAALTPLKLIADLNPSDWDQVARNGPVTLAEREQALNMRNQLMRDRQWVAKYFDGDRQAVSLMTRLNCALSMPVGTPLPIGRST